jgi:hypothetical protein
MNKKITAVITAAFLIAPLSAVNAASPAPKVKNTTAPEGTAKHEMGESSKTQANEAKKSKPAKTTNKVIVKKKAKTTPTPTA